MPNRYTHGSVTQELIKFPGRRRKTKVSIVWFEVGRENPTRSGYYLLRYSIHTDWGQIFYWDNDTKKWLSRIGHRPLFCSTIRAFRASYVWGGILKEANEEK